MRAVAVNVGANTNEPGVRAPVDAEGRFEFVPIPESEPTSEPVPTYGDLGLSTVDLPTDLADVPVHLDPEFPDLPGGERYTYGDPHGVKARPLLDLSAGDYAFFYATLDSPDGPADWQPPRWGAYVIGHFRLASDPLSGEAYRDLPAADRDPFSNNAHVKREPFDARVLLSGDPAGSALYERAVPLSAPSGGTEPNRLVALSSDSGRGPWWRRPLRFDRAGVEELLAVHRERDLSRCFEA